MRKVVVTILSCIFVCLFMFNNNVQAQTVYEMMGQPVSNQTGLQEFTDMPEEYILARTIYSEAMGESYTGKVAIYHIAMNRLRKNLSEFGRPTLKDVLLKTPGGFDGLTTSYARTPDVTSQAWKDSCDIAMTGGTNPIGNCLWYNTNTVFTSNTYTSGGYTYYRFGTSSKKIIEKVVIGKHTFFRVEGY